MLMPINAKQCNHCAFYNCPDCGACGNRVGQSQINCPYNKIKALKPLKQKTVIIAKAVGLYMNTDGIDVSWAEVNKKADLLRNHISSMAVGSIPFDERVRQLLI